MHRLLLYNRAKTEVTFMAQTMVNFRMDEDLKKGMEQACKEMGLSMTTAFTMFATKGEYPKDCVNL